MQRIFVTGGTGFIGRHTVQKLCLKNECIVLTRQEQKDTSGVKYVMGDVKDRAGVKTLLKQYRCGTLLHFAWDVKSPSFAVSNVNADWQKWSTSIVEDFLQLGGHNVISSGTCFEYASDAQGELTEQSVCRPATPYGNAKLSTYNKIKQICSSSGARFVWGRIFYLYGPGEESRKLITNAFDTLKRGEDFVCHTPENCIDYVHVEDASNAFKVFTENANIDGVFNICTGRAGRVGDMLLYIANRLGAKEKLHLCPHQESVRVAGSNKAMLDVGVKLKYEDVYRGLDTYF